MEEARDSASAKRSHAMVVKASEVPLWRIGPVGSAPLVKRMKLSSDWIDGNQRGLGGREAGLRQERAFKSICCL